MVAHIGVPHRAREEKDAGEVPALADVRLDQRDAVAVVAGHNDAALFGRPRRDRRIVRACEPDFGDMDDVGAVLPNSADGSSVDVLVEDESERPHQPRRDTRRSRRSFCAIASSISSSNRSAYASAWSSDSGSTWGAKCA